MTTTRICEVHRVHVPKPLRIVKHHIRPLAMGGADIAENWVWVCDTGHYNIHRLMGYLLSGKPKLPALGARAERALAKRGYDEWIAANKPGRPVYEVW